MTEPIRTWVPLINQAFSVLDDQPTQLQEACFALKELLVAAGWTLKQSSNGIAVVADDVGNWASAADIRFGNAGSGSWAVFESQAGWLTNSETVQLKFYVDENLALNDAQRAPIQMAPKGYDTDGAAGTAATASMDCDSGGTAVLPADGNNVTLDNGPSSTVTFEFDTNDSVAETATLRKVDISAAVDDDDVRDALIPVINATPLLNLIASSGGPGIVSLVNKIRGTAGNITIGTTVVGNFDVADVDGTNGSLPTLTAGVETAVISNGANVIPWNAPNAGHMASWRTSRGDIMFGLKRKGDPYFTAFFILTSNEDDGSGNQRWMLYGYSPGLTTNALQNLPTSGNWKGVTPDGGTLNTTIEAHCTAWSWAAQWLKGLNQQGGTHDVPIEIGNDTGTVSASPRFLGTMIDVYGCPTKLLFGAVVDGERSQTQRRVCLGAGVFVFVKTADLPFK